MKKVIIVVVIILVIIAMGLGAVSHKVYTPKQKELDVVVDQSNVDSLSDKLQMDIPSIDELNNEDKVIEIKEYEYREAELNNAETSVLMNLAISTVLPCSNVQAMNHDGWVEISMMVKLTSEMIASINSPVKLPEKVAAYLTVELRAKDGNIVVNTTSLDLNGIDIPDGMIASVNDSIKNTFENQGYQEIDVQEEKILIKGELPTKVE